jgi:DNA invertase Pin-like site-specific DNA recombinase
MRVLVIGGTGFIGAHNLDLCTPAGRLMMHIIGAMAEFERSLIQERIVAGIAAAWKRGQRMGRPKVYVSAMKVTEPSARQGRPGGLLRRRWEPA